MKTVAAAASALLAIAVSFTAVMPAEAGPKGNRGRGHQFGLEKRISVNSQAAQVSQTGSAVNIVQNGNQNGVVAVANTGTTNIAQNGNNNNLTVIQVTVVSRGKGGQKRGYGHR